MFLPDPVLRAVFRSGRFEVVDARGKRHVYGDGSGDRAVSLRFVDRATEARLLRNPQLALGEGYMDGRIVIQEGTIYDLLDLAARNVGFGWGHWSMRMAADLRTLVRRFRQSNRVRKARRNVAHHYDLSDSLYELFLDADRQYSCAYFTRAGEGLDAAQQDKKRHIASKLLLAPGKRVLDIGCGWGGLALYLADVEQVRVDGVTLSKEQLAVARARAQARRPQDVNFSLTDYREVQGHYDRIVSVGMFEHVGVPYYPAFFGKIRELLADDGVALVHSIGRADGPGATNPWVQKYIFPGGYTPALSEVLPAIERQGLFVTDIEILRLHYAETLRHWRERFCARWEEATALYDERFCRMWEFYLAGAEAGFRHSGLMVFQIQIAKRVDTVPLTRDYMFDWERRQAAAEQPQPRRRAG